MSDKDFLLQLRQEFLDGLPSEISSCEEILLIYEKSQDLELISQVMRILHSLKGSAQAVELPKMVEVLHSIESFCVLQKTSPTSGTQFVSVLFKKLDVLKDQSFLQAQLEEEVRGPALAGKKRPQSA